jgi:hypothetical protein
MAVFGRRKCHVTSNKVTSKLECAEDKFQTRRWVRETPPTTTYARDLTGNAGPCSKLRDTCYSSRVYMACMRREDNNEWRIVKDTCAVAYLLKARTIEPEREPLLGNGS